MTMHKVEYSQKLKLKNHKLKHRLDEAKRELAAKDKIIEIMEASQETKSRVPLDMLECRKPTRVYALFLKEK